MSAHRMKPNFKEAVGLHNRTRQRAMKRLAEEFNANVESTQRLETELTDARETIRQSNMAKGNLKRSKEANNRKDADIKELKGKLVAGQTQLTAAQKGNDRSEQRERQVEGKCGGIDMVESLTRAQSRRQEREYRYQEAAKKNPFAHDFSNDRAEKFSRAA